MADTKNKVLAVHAGLVAETITAGGAGDAAADAGDVIQRSATGQMFDDGLLIIPCTAALDAGESAALTAVLEHGNDTDVGAGADTFVVSITNEDTAADTITTVAHFPFDIRGCGDYIQATVTPDLTAADTDTLQVGDGIWIFAEGQTEPVDQSNRS